MLLKVIIRNPPFLHNVVSLYWALLRAILGHVRPVGCELDTCQSTAIVCGVLPLTQSSLCIPLPPLSSVKVAPTFPITPFMIPSPNTPS